MTAWNYDTGLHDPDIKPPDRSCVYCNCCLGRWYWTKSRWHSYPCTGCNHSRCSHGYSGHVEYDNYLNKGCWVCGKPAVAIDHNHDIHSKRAHSCEACRRGPICYAHNRMLVTGQSSADIRQLANALEAYELGLAA